MPLILYVINLVLGVLLLSYEHNSSSDKSIIVTVILYGILVVGNFIFALMSGLDGKPYSKHFFYSGVVLIVLVVLYNSVI